MKQKIVGGVAAVLIGFAVGGYFLTRNGPNRAPVVTTIRISVSPREQLDFVTTKASTPLFKYLMGKKSGVKAALTQKLTVKALPETSELEAKLGVLSKEEGKRYADGFVETLQDMCGKDVKLALAGDQSQ